MCVSVSQDVCMSRMSLTFPAEVPSSPLGVIVALPPFNSLLPAHMQPFPTHSLTHPLRAAAGGWLRSLAAARLTTWPPRWWWWRRWRGGVRAEAPAASPALTSDSLLGPHWALRWSSLWHLLQALCWHFSVASGSGCATRPPRPPCRRQA